MSYPVMPTIPLSLSKGVKKTPHGGGTIFQPTAGNMGNAAIQIMPYPCWDYDVDLVSVEGDINIANTVLAGFVGTFIQCGGRSNLFLFTDPNDNGVVAMPFGIGDGETTVFQLTRSIGGVGIDVIQNLNGSPTIYINGVLNSSWSIDNTGIITFETAPAVGHVLTWTGNYYMLCRFAADSLDGLALMAFNRAGQEFWDCDSIKFSTEFVQPGTAGANVQGVVWENFDGGQF